MNLINIVGIVEYNPEKETTTLRLSPKIEELMECQHYGYTINQVKTLANIAHIIHDGISQKQAMLGAMQELHRSKVDFAVDIETLLSR